VDATGLLGKRFYLQAFTARLSFFTLRHSNPATTLKIYAHWVPGVRRVTSAVLDIKNANKMQMEASGEEIENSGRV